MKSSLAFLVVLAVSGTFNIKAVPIESQNLVSVNHYENLPELVTRNLKDDLDDFLNLVPVDQVQQLFFQYLSEDEDFGEAIDYLLSDEFKSLMIEVESMTEVKKLFNYLQESGLDAYGFVNKINDHLGIDHIKPFLGYRVNRITGGLPGFIQDVKALLPVDKIKQMYHDKLVSSQEFADLVRRLQSQEFQSLVTKIMVHPKMQNLIERSMAKGVDVKAILDFLTKLLGIKFPSRSVFYVTRNLKDDLDDFLNLVPVDQVQQLFFQYLSEDEDFGEAIDYLLSDEFKSLMIEVESMTEVKKLFNYLQESGLDAYGFVNKINDHLGIDHIKPFLGYRVNRITGGLPGFIQDVKALLPVDKIKQMYHDKLVSSQEFADLVRRLQSQEFQSLVTKIMVHPKMQNLIERSMAKGVDVKAILDFLTKLLGIKFPSRSVFYVTRNLKDDLDDFLNLVPVDQVQQLFFQYLSEDEDFGEAIDYLLSDEFKSLMIEVESMTEVKKLFNYLQESGLDAYGFVNKINDHLGIDHIKPFLGYRVNRITGGLPGFIQDVKALLPVDKIKQMYHDKLVSSQEFADLVRRLQSQEFQSLVNKIMVNPKMQDLIERSMAKGVDVKAILDFLTKLLGIKFPYRLVLFTEDEEVIDVFRQIWSLVPLDDIIDVIVDYTVEDKDFRKVIVFMLSDEFKAILADIEEIQELKDFAKYFDAVGIDVYLWIDALNSLIGIEKSLSDKNYLKITSGVPGLLHDIRCLLPIEKLYDLYDRKLVESPKFAAFIYRLESHELQNAVNALGKHQGFNTLLNRLEKLGVDWDKVTEIISAIFGIKFPPRSF